MSEDLDFEDALRLLESEDDAPKRRVRKSLYDERTLANWLKVPHNLMNPDTNERYECEVPNHNMSRSRGQGMVTVIDGLPVCRICFLNSTDLDG